MDPPHPCARIALSLALPSSVPTPLKAGDGAVNAAHFSIGGGKGGSVFQQITSTVLSMRGSMFGFNAAEG
jgi:hypothetical protein